MAHVLYIDGKALRGFSDKLEKISKSALPIAVRQTLNDAAYDVKQVTMPQTSDASFIRRKPTFWKAKSRVEGAKGFDVDNMNSTVGFLEGKKHSQAVRNLEEQEHGGTIKDKDFIPLDDARHGDSYYQQVELKNWLKKIDSSFATTKWDGRFPSSIKKASDYKRFNKNGGLMKLTHKQKFFGTVMDAGKGRYVLGNNKSQVLFRVKKIYKVDKKNKYELEPLYSFRKGRVIRIKKATHFMENAALKSASKMNQFFINNAKRKIDKI